MRDFRILGPLEVVGDGGVVPLEAEERIFLALMLLDPGRVATRARLIDAVWGGKVPADPEAALQRMASGLRTSLGADVVEASIRGYRVRVRPGELDVDRFRVLVESARTSARATRIEKLRHALALWRGRPLPEVAAVSHAQPYIAELERLRLAAADQLAQAADDTPSSSPSY
jgi:DNA-binding SARP family transcriptional activator